MVRIEGSNIIMTHGDTAYLALHLTNLATREDYVPAVTDVITFEAKKDYTDQSNAITKSIDPETCVLELDPADTAGLGMGAADGRYVYDIKVASGDDRMTVVSGMLFLTDEV